MPSQLSSTSEPLQTSAQGGNTMMRQQHSYSWLFKAATKSLKYFLLGLAGCTVTYVLAQVLSFGGLASLMVLLLEKLALRALVVVFCLWAIAVITESLR